MLSRGRKGQKCPGFLRERFSNFTADLRFSDLEGDWWSQGGSRAEEELLAASLKLGELDEGPVASLRFSELNEGPVVTRGARAAAKPPRGVVEPGLSDQAHGQAR